MYIYIYNTYIIKHRFDIISFRYSSSEEVLFNGCSCRLGALSSNWYNKRITSIEERKNGAVTSQNGLHREINEHEKLINIF